MQLRTLLATLSFFGSLVCFGQANPFMNDGNGKPLYMRVNYTAEGSPYLFEDYHLAEVVTTDGTRYRDIMIKVNVLNNQVQFLNDNGGEMISTMPVKRIAFSSFIVQDGVVEQFVVESFGSSVNTPGEPIYQVLDSGKAMLLKEIRIEARDDKKYGEAGITRVFKRTENYFVMQNGERKKLTRNKEAVLTLLADKRQMVEAYMEKQGMKARSEEELLKLFRFYNSLFL